MSSVQRRESHHLRRRQAGNHLSSTLGGWRAAAGGAIALGLLGGALAERQPSNAILVCLAIGAILALAMAGERAFPWAIVLVAVVPWYPFIAEAAEPPIVRQKVLCAAIAAAPLVPWLWSLPLRARGARPGKGALMVGVLYLGLAILIYQTLGSVSALIDSTVVGYVFIGVTFLCARRFGNGEGWLAAAFGGLLVLGVMGAEAYMKAPSNRIGYFVGYPITYGALVVGLLPAALLFAFQRSRLLAGAVGAGTAALLIFSESRSSWVAVAVMLVVAVALQSRAGNLRALAAVITAVAILAGLIAGTGLHKIVERKLSAKVVTSQSVTHREFSVGYAIKQIGERPLFGAGAPGYSAQESASKTDIGALDNGYLSVSVDLGVVGLVAALLPIAVALRVLSRCARFGVTPGFELALALGVLGIAVVTVFYDSFYWAQLDLLLGAMGGVLSTRVARIARPEPEPEPDVTVRATGQGALASVRPAT